MPLHILLPIVVIGIAGITIFLHLSGHSKRLSLGNKASALAAWDRQWPDDPASEVKLCKDGHAALITSGKEAGLVWAFGADSVAHWLRGASVSENETGLRVSFGDFNSPRVDLTLNDTEKGQWKAAIEEHLT